MPRDSGGIARQSSCEEALRTDVGFVKRVDQQHTFHSIEYRWFPEHWLIDWGPTFEYERSHNYDDVLEDEVAQLGLQFGFARSISVNLRGQRVLVVGIGNSAARSIPFGCSR